MMTGRVLALLGLLLAGLFGLGMSVCGGGYTVMVLYSVLRPNKGNDVILLLMVSVPSLLFGVYLLRLALSFLNELRRKDL